MTNMKIKCAYCGQPSLSDWLVCGQGQSWGCGAALPRPTKVKATHLGPYNQVVTITGLVTNPILINDTTGETIEPFQRMGNAVDDLKIELGRSLLPIFDKILDPLSSILGAE